ncbi:MAG: hypothetical protein MJ252_17530, partial [archaeon]|nr:hypothetical protein [archaeon]
NVEIKKKMQLLEERRKEYLNNAGYLVPMSESGDINEEYINNANTITPVSKRNNENMIEIDNTNLNISQYSNPPNVTYVRTLISADERFNEFKRKLDNKLKS